jgi:C2 domain
MKKIFQTLEPHWNEEFIFRVKPAEHKLVLQVFDENRLTRDDFLGVVELSLQNLPKEQEGRTILSKQYILRPRRLVSLLFTIEGFLVPADTLLFVRGTNMSSNYERSFPLSITVISLYLVFKESTSECIPISHN